VNKDKKEQGVENVVKPGSGIWVFPFSSRDDIVCDVDKSSSQTRHKDVMLKQNQSLSLITILQMHISSERLEPAFHLQYFTVTFWLLQLGHCISAVFKSKYTDIQYTIFSKTLYLQRIKYTIDSPL